MQGSPRPKVKIAAAADGAGRAAMARVFADAVLRDARLFLSGYGSAGMIDMLVIYFLFVDCK